MKIWKYNSYAEYVAAQIEANKRKVNNVWVRPETVAAISGLMYGTYVGTILCHGTRNGREQALFRGLYGHAIIMGTEISDNAKNFPLTVEHDFHEPLSGWEGCCHIVYSNSLDHAYDPYKALCTWRDQLIAGGRLFVEYCFTERCNASSASDPLEITREELLQLFAEVGLGLCASFETSGVKGEDTCNSTVFMLERIR